MSISKSEIEKQLINITRAFFKELQAERALQAITLDASLERELGMDSLGKVELFDRIEKNFSIKLPEKAMIDADSLRDLVKVIEHADSSSAKHKKSRTVLTVTESEALDLSSAKNLAEVLLAHAEHNPERPHIYLQNENGEEQIIRYGQLAEEAKHVARGIRNRGILPGETIAIMLPTSDTFFYCYCGILLAGAVPVPIYPPFRPDRIEEYAKREAKILQNAQARLLITFSRAEILSNILQTFIPSLKDVVTFKNLRTTKGDLPPVTTESDDPALIQYTSGSTGDPKGVLLTHKNMLTNIRSIGKAVPIKQTDVVVSWLPLYHDMGLMSWLASFYFGIPLTILSPITFLTRPEQWLWAIHYHRATLSGGPNFAYELCVKKINPKDLEGLDLSSWRFAFNGAEAINPRTLERFSKRFAEYGFNPESFAPVYGLAESTVALTFPTEKRLPRIDKIQREYFEIENKAIPIKSPNDKDSLEFIGCGIAMPEHAIRIVDDNGNELADRMIGNIQFNGPSSMQGYFNNPAATQKAYRNGWWDSGDTGYLVEGEVFIIGRKKDLIIKAGRNLYPEEVEEVVTQLASIRKGCVVAFGVNDPNLGTEKLVVVAETYQLNKEDRQKIRAEIIDNMAISLGIPPDVVVLVPPRTIPKTSSGKLQRSACKDAYIKGKLTRQPLPAKLQMIKLAFMSLTKKILGWLSYFGKLCYTLYVSIIALITIPIIWLMLFLLPTKPARLLSRFWARNFFRLSFCPLNIKGKENLTEHSPMIFVANHTSYSDALLLLSILPLNVLFIAKKEVLTMPIIKTFVKKLGFLTVDRLDFAKNLENKNSIEEHVRQGHSIAIFPEGTFTYATGLRPFKLGAFNIAVDTNTPICPIAIHGTRFILRGDTLLCKPHSVKINIGKPILPKEKNWSDIIKLHTLVRTEIAKHCGEPVIDIISAGPVVD